MADSKGEGSGLFARVIKFVRNPTTNWTALDVPDEAQESGYSRQMLKEMIERKRRNDFVRKREFDMLRKLRRSEAIAGHDPGARPSFFQSSLPSRPDDRASTLKKIDEIEAQMSQQWWKTRNGDSTTRTGGLTTGSAPMSMTSGMSSGLGGSTPASVPLPIISVPGALPSQPVGLAPSAGLPPLPPVPDTLPASLALPPDLGIELGFDLEGPASSLFSPSRVAAVDVEEFTHDSALEDAAIRFANGDDDAAEAALKSLVGPEGQRRDHEETWLALFDLYRATGRQERFEQTALEFVGCFGRSAPQWVNLVDAAAATPAPRPGASTRAADWICPAVLSPQALVAMQTALARAAPPLRLSWVRLTRIEEAALEPFVKLLGQWSLQPVRLHFLAAEVLDGLIKRHAVSGERGTDPGWWKLRMELLRLMNRPDEFEIVALEYCVTYEVSPPSWEAPRCQLRALLADGSEPAGPDDLPRLDLSLLDGVSGTSDLDSRSEAQTQPTQPSRVDLAGALQGDAVAALEQLPRLLPGELVHIACGRLQRVDFAAAGTLLNWSTARQAEGCSVQFVEVHRLVAAFFNIVGVSGPARVIVRRD